MYNDYKMAENKIEKLEKILESKEGRESIRILLKSKALKKQVKQLKKEKQLEKKEKEEKKHRIEVYISTLYLAYLSLYAVYIVKGNKHYSDKHKESILEKIRKKLNEVNINNNNNLCGTIEKLIGDIKKFNIDRELFNKERVC